MKKIIISFLLLILICSFFSSIVLATDPVSAMKGMEKGGNAGTSKEKLQKIANPVIGLIQIAGTGISLIMVTMLGIKYMLAAPSDKADVKRQIMPTLIGAIILFASAQIVQILADFTQGKLFQ